MSAVYFNSPTSESKLRGSERAYMGTICVDIASGVLASSSWRSVESKLSRISNCSYPLDSMMAVRSWLTAAYDGKLTFNGETYPSFEVVLNTVIATASPALCLLARMHGSCEIHAWVAEWDRLWFADVIEQGRKDNILRPDQGWEDVMEHFRQGPPGPIVMSFSVTDSFPNRFVSDWVKPADDEDGETWYDLDDEKQWELSMSALKKDPYLQITPENLTTQGFGAGTSLWDALQSPEWNTPN